MPHGDASSPRSCAYFHAVLRKALADAVRDELVARNVAALVEAPVVRRSPLEPLSTGEAKLVLAAASGDRLRAQWLVMLSIGLRRGEALALRWDDLDLDAGTVTISRSLQRVRGARDPETGRRRGELVEVAPKTAASVATIALPDVLVGALIQHRRSRAAERLAAKARVDPGLVFTTPAGMALEPRNVRRAWEGLCGRAKVRTVRRHDLRHSAASVHARRRGRYQVDPDDVAALADVHHGGHLRARAQGGSAAAANQMDVVLRGLGATS